MRRAGPTTVVVWAQTPVAGRAHRLARLARAFPGVRVHAAGPGWAEPLAPPSARLATLTAATAACLRRGCRRPAGVAAILDRTAAPVVRPAPGRGAGVSPAEGVRGDQ